jgi:acyl phosphate:glycerol-3-phosphate acyltransferase
MVELGLKFTLAYLLGSVLGSLVVGQLRGGVDIRALGSGNPGGTNALRTQGKAFAFWVMLIDVGKGLAAVLVVPYLPLPGVTDTVQVSRELVTYACGFAAVLGHVFPVWFEFKGGKGGATAAGVLCALSLPLAVPVIGLWVLIIAISGYVGLATMSAAWGAVLYVGFTQLPQEWAFFVLTAAIAALIVYTHRSNIERMRNGTEVRMGMFLRRR